MKKRKKYKKQEELQQPGAKKKEGQDVWEKVQLVGNQEQLQQLGAKKKEDQEVPEVYVGFGEDLSKDPSDRYYVGFTAVVSRCTL